MPVHTNFRPASFDQVTDPAEIRRVSAHESYPVAPFVVPREIRPHLLALYGFMRLIDDVGDRLIEGRSSGIVEVEADLVSVFQGNEPRLAVLQQLSRTVREYQLDPLPFADMIEAARLDQTVRHYADRAALQQWLDLSGPPYGRVLLQLMRADTPQRRKWMGSLCIATALIDQCCDVREDASNGRVYLPMVELERFGVEIDDLHAHVSSPGLRQLILHHAAFAQARLRDSAPLVRSLHGWPRRLGAGLYATADADLQWIRRRQGDIRPGDARRHRDVAATWLRSWSMAPTGQCR